MTVPLTGCGGNAEDGYYEHGAHKFSAAGGLHMDRICAIQQRLPDFPFVLHGATRYRRTRSTASMRLAAGPALHGRARPIRRAERVRARVRRPTYRTAGAAGRGTSLKADRGRRARPGSGRVGCRVGWGRHPNPARRCPNSAPPSELTAELNHNLLRRRDRRRQERRAALVVGKLLSRRGPRPNPDPPRKGPPDRGGPGRRRYARGRYALPRYDRWAAPAEATNDARPIRPSGVVLLCATA
jgi:hypothetical protein